MWFSKNELHIYRVKANDLLVSEGGEVGKTAIWNNELEECYIQNSVHKITFNKKCNPYYYLYLFYILGKAEYFKSIVNQVSIAHLTREKLIKIKCPVPSYKEQCEIVNGIEKLNREIDSTIQKAHYEIEAINEFKEAIISEIITGKLSPFATN